MVKAGIITLAQMIEARKDYRRVSSLLPAHGVEHQLNAIVLQHDRGSARRLTDGPYSLASQGTAHSTSRVLDYQESGLGS